MDFERIDAHLPPDLLAAAKELAQARDISLGQLIRDSLQRELKLAAKPKTRTCADEALVARLQRLLASDIAAARSWQDMDAILARHGLHMRPAGGGLTVHGPAGDRLCKTSELGFGYARLVRRFGAPMPGHPHRMAHLLPGARLAGRVSLS